MTIKKSNTIRYAERCGRFYDKNGTLGGIHRKVAKDHLVALAELIDRRSPQGLPDHNKISYLKSIIRATAGYDGATAGTALSVVSRAYMYHPGVKYASPSAFHKIYSVAQKEFDESGRLMPLNELEDLAMNTLRLEKKAPQRRPKLSKYLEGKKAREGKLGRQLRQEDYGEI